MKLTQIQQFIILGVFIFGAAIYAYYKFGIEPLNKEIAEKRTLLDQKKKDLEEAKRIVARYVEFKKRADSVQRELEWIQSRIPKTLERTKFMEAVYLVQRNSGVFLTTFTSTGALVSGKEYAEIPADINFLSDYKGLQMFLHQLNVSKLFLTARSLSVASKIDSEHPDATLTVRMTVSGVQSK